MRKEFEVGSFCHLRSTRSPIPRQDVEESHAPCHDRALSIPHHVRHQHMVRSDHCELASTIKHLGECVEKQTRLPMSVSLQSPVFQRVRSRTEAILAILLAFCVFVLPATAQCPHWFPGGLSFPGLG